MAGKSWKTIVQEKQADRARLIEDVVGKAKAAEGEAPEGGVKNEDIVHATATEIVQNIQAGKPGWTAEKVVLAFAIRAAEAQEKINCLTEIMFAQALEEARALDAEFAQTKRIRGPLHGLPISLKDCYKVKGYDATIGFTQWVDKPSDVDAEIVNHIRAAGGIPFVKTNVPQTMLSFECSNPLWGRTLNPYSPNHTCGGSSGGEAALAACDGAALGFGSDIGGSLRIPPGFSGVYALKPSQNRVARSGTVGCVPGFEALIAANGPIARSVPDIELASRVLFGKSDALNETLPPVPYRDVTIPKKLKFGYYKTDQLIKVSPACQRAVQETVDALREQGHECVEFVIPNNLEAARVFVALTSADGYKTLTSHIGPDPRDRTLFLVTLGSKIPSFIRSLACWAARTFKGDYSWAALFSNSHPRTVSEFWAETKAKNEYIKFFHENVWGKHDFDGIICPVNALPTVPHGGSALLSPLAFATSLYNVVDHPVGIVPVTRVDKTKDAISEEWNDPATGGPKGSPIIHATMYEGPKAAYDPVAMDGIPVGVQVVGKPWEDEKVVEMMKVVDGALGKRGFGPGAWAEKS
ncbi:hypothetical protein FRC04_000648 [Tulasnella sp. 424]|nr:hypothetical protein FRC04_000648 [Tulasnella sp. 424]KAG8974917.1 hypothetical protein FRC05_006594 [Tulasnella sp. 425]